LFDAPVSSIFLYTFSAMMALLAVMVDEMSPPRYHMRAHSYQRFCRQYVAYLTNSIRSVTLPFS